MEAGDLLLGTAPALLQDREHFGVVDVRHRCRGRPDQCSEPFLLAGMSRVEPCRCGRQMLLRRVKGGKELGFAEGQRGQLVIHCLTQEI